MVHQDELQLQQTLVHIQTETAEVGKAESFKRFKQNESLETRNNNPPPMSLFLPPASQEPPL